VSFSLSQPGRTSIDIYDVRGRRIKTVLGQDLAAGNHQVICPTGRNPPAC
jgi:hypothetical protein